MLNDTVFPTLQPTSSSKNNLQIAFQYLITDVCAFVITDSCIKNQSCKTFRGGGCERGYQYYSFQMIRQLDFDYILEFYCVSCVVA